MNAFLRASLVLLQTGLAGGCTPMNDNRRLQKLYELSLLLSGEPAEIFQQIARMIAEFFDVRMVSLNAIRNQTLHFKCVYLDGKFIKHSADIPLNMTPCALISKNQTPLKMDQVAKMFPQAPFLKSDECRFFFGVPALDRQGRAIGTTCLLDDKPGEMSEQDHELLRIFSQRIALEMERESHLQKHRRIEKQLLDSRQHLLAAQKIARIAYWEWDFNNNQVNWPDEMYQLLGFKPGEFTADTNSLLEITHPEDKPILEQALSEVRETGSFSVDHRIQMADGQLRFIHSQGQVQYDENNTASTLLGIEQDITERKYIEQALDTLTAFNLTDNLQSFFEICTSSLARVYNAEYAFIGLYKDTSMQSIITQAVWVKDHCIENFEYFLQGTPCADVLNMKTELISKDAAILYPEDTMLADMGIESYFGIPLVNSSGKTLGLVTVMDTHPMDVQPWIKPVLGLFAQRISSMIEFKQAEEKLKTSEKDLSSIFSNMQDTYYRTDTEGRIILVSPASEQLLGYKQEEATGLKLADLYVNPEERKKLIEILNKNGKAEHFEVAMRHKNGDIVWVSSNAQYYYNDQGEILGIEGAARNITQNRDNELRMRIMSKALEQSDEMIMITDNQGIVEYVNPAYERVTGYTLEQLKGRKSNILRSGKHSKEFYRNLWNTILSGKVFSDVLVNRKKDGSLYYEEKTIISIRDEQQNISHFVATGRDITNRIENEKRLTYLAHHDVLTQLPNRALFLDRLKQSLAMSRRHNKRLAVLFIDLDRFKNINDTLGHKAGDELLIQLASRLGKDIRRNDTVARLGGDEFAVLLNDISQDEDVAQMAEKLLNSLQPPFEIDQQQLFMSASIGISLFPSDGTDAGTLLKYADTAMYRAKDKGKNTFQFYSAEMSSRAYQRLLLENNLRGALERDEFVLYYQPQINLQNNQVTGAEALIRWQHPEHGLVSPLDFISLLEETGLIVQVGYWILEQSCRTLKHWLNAGHSQMTISVNISARQFHSADFVDRIQKTIQNCGVKAQQIELEITESILMENQQHTTQALEQLVSAGFRIAIDDFGTGYSSLAYLRRFQIDTLKVDQSFIQDVIDDDDDAAITIAIIAMAHSLNLNVVAEGVETAEQLDFVKQHHCQLVQGYYFSKPLTENEMKLYLQKNSNIKEQS